MLIQMLDAEKKPESFLESCRYIFQPRVSLSKQTQNFHQRHYLKVFFLSSSIRNEHLDKSKICNLIEIPFQMRSHWMKSQKESLRLEEAGLTGDVLDSALSAFILEVVARHGEPSRRLCNKDPFTLKSGTYLKQLFPKSKFLFMVRDGRATVHSIITRKVTITGFDLKSYRQSLTKWNAAITAMNDQCEELGPEFCLKVYYEQLVRIFKYSDLNHQSKIKRILT